LASSDPALPAGYAARPASHGDLDAIDALYVASEEAMGIRPQRRSGYLSWRWSQPVVDLGVDTRVVLAPDGSMAAFGMAFVEEDAPSVLGCMGRVDVAHLGRGLGAWLLSWFDARAAARRGVKTCRLGIEEPDAPGHVLAAAHGYERVRTSFEMGVALDPDLRPSDPPSGVTVRPFVPGEERDLWRVEVEAFRDHWDHEEDQPFESFMSDWFDDVVHPPRILVAEQDGQMVGVLGWIIEPDVPYVFTVAVLPHARRRGIATALLEHTKADAAAAGHTEMTLSVDATNPTGAVRAYEKVGMTVFRSLAVYHRDVA
jgi:ribosomal protein S18 acetylase RimI-like enzyme